MLVFPVVRAVEYIKDRVKEGMSELEAEDRAVELILAPSDGRRSARTHRSQYHRT